MENNNILASEKQIDYLKKLGFKGSTEGLTKTEAAHFIRELKGGDGAQPQGTNYSQPRTNYAPAQTNNSVAQRGSFSTFMKTTGEKLVNNALRDPQRGTQFIANIVSAVASNPGLQECEQSTILSAGLQAEALHFPLNNSFGYGYLVPFNDNKNQRKVAQFQIGYKGYIQLAIRSGQYKDIAVTEVKEGELADFNPLTGQRFNWISDYDERCKRKTIGYAARIELVNGFSKEMYWTYEHMLDHADKYSQAFSRNGSVVHTKKGDRNKVSYEEYVAGKYNKGDEWLYSSFWYKNFDEMAKKTMLRQLLSKWGVMSVEMQEAFIKDQTVMNEDGSYRYVDNETGEIIDEERKHDNVVDVHQEQEEANASVEPSYDEGYYSASEGAGESWYE